MGNWRGGLLRVSRLKMNEYGYLEIVATGHPITPEMVKKLSEDEIVSLLRG